MTKMSNVCLSLLVSVSKQRYQFTAFYSHYQVFTLFIVQNRAGRGTDDLEVMELPIVNIQAMGIAKFSIRKHVML